MRDTLHGLIRLSCGLLLLSSPTIANAQSTEMQIAVSVVDSDGLPVGDLTPSDIIITEDGVRREVLSVRRDSEPKQIALLVDTSQAAGPAILNFKKAAGAFVESIGERHELSIISFGGTPRILTQATHDRGQLRNGVDKIFSYSDTASYLLDAVSATARGFERSSAPRPVIVVLTTLGIDYSNADDRSTLDRLKDTGAAMHTIVLARSGTGSGRGLERGPFQRDPLEFERFLEQGPTQTGGRRRNLQTFTAVEQAVHDLTAQLLNQYVVVYSRPGMLIPPERIQVAANRDGLDARGTPVIIESDQ